MAERGQTMTLTALVLPIVSALLVLLVLNMGWYAKEMTALQSAARAAAEDGAMQVEALGGGMLSPARARAAAVETARLNLVAMGYDPALLDGADAPGCETGGGACVYVETTEVCGLSDPLGAAGTFCGPFVSVRFAAPVRAVLGGYTITPTFRAVAEVGRSPNTGVAGFPSPTPTLEAPPVVPGG